MRATLRSLFRRGWLLGIPVAAILAVVGFGGVALAHGIDRDDVSSRVTVILEEDEESVKEAFDDAANQKAEEAVQAWLDILVEAERITQDEADEYMDWYEDRPDWVAGFGMGRHSGGIFGLSELVAETLGVEEDTVSDAISQAISEARSEALQEKLDEAVADGNLTQEQADEIAERIENGEFRGKRGHWGRVGRWGGWGIGRSHWSN